jgi:hypothetical protein
MKTTIRVLIISAIVAATPLFGMCVFMVFSLLSDSYFDWDTLFGILICFLGCLGYFGLFKSLDGLHTNAHRAKVLLLLSGVLSSVGFVLYSGIVEFLKWMISLDEPIELIVFILPNFVSIAMIYFLIRNYMLTPTGFGD